MTDQQIIEAVAIMDGWEHSSWWCSSCSTHHVGWRKSGITFPMDAYLSNIEAVRPVVMKQSIDVQNTFDMWLRQQPLIATATAREWCEALLRATGKWNTANAPREGQAPR